MPSPLQRLRHDERGMSFIFVGVGFFAFLACTTLAIDVGMFMTARSQAQNSADAGALAGATALVFNSFTDRTPTGPAVQSAINTALANQVIGSDVSVKTADVTFPNDPAGNPTRVKVDVYRTDAADRNNPVPTLIGGIFGVKTVNITATATAEASPANAMTCVKPFMIPDKWEEHTAPASEFNEFDNKGNPVPKPDIYVPPTDQVNYTGYTVAKDVGTTLVLRAGQGDQLNPSFSGQPVLHDPGAGRQTRPDAAGHPGSHGSRPKHVLAAGPRLRVREGEQVLGAEPARVPDPAVRPAVLHRGQVERPRGRFQAHELPRVLRGSHRQ
ncbi:MAG: hypothetical protein DMF99_18720 [Acidobacteria bacterium]|nr:MAG: hypothetical protein DMF99_18720 [Acidobacteriota bacterium]